MTDKPCPLCGKQTKMTNIVVFGSRVIIDYRWFKENMISNLDSDDKLILGYGMGMTKCPGPKEKKGGGV